MTEHCDIGLIGLAVMGQNLILNMADHGYQVAAYNRTTGKERINEAFNRDPGLENLLLDPYFKEAVESSQKGWRITVSTATLIGIPIPAISAGLTYFDAYRCERLPHNLLQAQRDYFGVHTYERLDEEGVFHSDWLGMRREPE